MITRTLGKSGIPVSAIGLGCMGLSEFYGPPAQESEAINLLHRAVDLGVTHFDTAEIYGQGRNEQLLGKAFAGRRGRIVLATKFGPQRDPATGAFLGWTALRPMSAAPAKRVFSDWVRTGSICTISTVWIHRLRSKRRWERWQSWLTKAK